jgi:hypothetical protein
MPKTDRVRVDYMPCEAAIEALQAAWKHYPRDNTQALIDWLVITGLAAMHWKAPKLYDDNRNRWKLPDELRVSDDAQ